MLPTLKLSIGQSALLSQAVLSLSKKERDDVNNSMSSESSGDQGGSEEEAPSLAALRQNGDIQSLLQQLHGPGLPLAGLLQVCRPLIAK